MSTASVAAAKIYVALSADNAYFEAFACSREPYRAIVDKSREDGLHSIEDGSEDYEKCVDCLEVLICCE
jgi:hypothetical protein